MVRAARYAARVDGATVLFLVGLLGIDRNYYQAAEIDGATRWKLNRCRLLFVLLNHFVQSILAQGLTSLDGAYGSVYNLDIAAAVIAVIPTILIFLIFQRSFVEGARLSGLK